MHWLQPDCKCKEGCVLEVGGAGRGWWRPPRQDFQLRRKGSESQALSGEDGRFLAASLPWDLKYPYCLDLMAETGAPRAAVQVGTRTEVSKRKLR